MADDVLGQLVGTAPGRLLEELARIGAMLAKNGRARPEIELYLSSGQQIRGRVVSVADDRQVAVITTGGSASAPAVTFVRIDQVAAMTVVDASLLVRAPMPDMPAPSRLELSRQLAHRADALAQSFGRGVQCHLASDLDDDGRRAVSLALPVLVDVLAAIASDDMGKAALQSVTEIELGASATGDVQREGSRLVTRAPKLLAEQFTLDALRKAVERVL